MDRPLQRADVTRRQLLVTGAGVGLAALVSRALPLAEALAQSPAPSDPDGTFQAYADTILPGRRVERTELGNPIHPLAIAGVHDEPGAVETDALALSHHPAIGFDALAPGFLADVESRALGEGGPFLALPYERRVRVCVGGLAFSNPSRQVWEAGAAVVYTAFCAAALVPEQRAEHAAGYRVMGLPGRAPSGYRAYSYRRRLARERTRRGYLP
jgi:hypothetical protein